MGQFELVGSQQKLKNTPNPTAPSGGKKGEMQIVGTDVPLKSAPAKESTFPKKAGEFEMVGTPLTLKSTPQVGFQAGPDLASQRAKANK